MAQPTNTFDTYDAVGIREDLSDQIYNVDPFATPLLSKFSKNKASATYHEWQTDTLDSPSSSNAHVEGSDTDGEAIVATTRLGNYTQIFKKSVTIPGTLESVTKAGRAKEVAYQLAKKAKSLKTDIETSVCDNNARVAGGSATAREMAGIPAWLTTNTSAGATGADPVTIGSTARTDGTQRTFTEALLKTVLKSCWDNGGNPDCLFVGGFNKQIASGFTGNGTRFDKAEDKTLHTAVDIYVSDFGQLKIVPARHVRARDGLVLQTDMWAISELRPMRQEELAKTGDSMKYQIIAECTLEAKNEQASGGVFDLTTS